MTLRSTLLVTHLLLSIPSLADDAFQAPLAEQSVLLDLQASENRLLAVGERGHILSSDDGQTWQQDQVPTTALLTAIDSKKDHLWAVGHDATILHKQGLDADWQIQMQAPELERPLLDVIFTTENDGIAIGAYGAYYQTNDGGNTWQLVLHAEFLNPYDLEYLNEIKEEDPEFYQEELASILPHLNRISMSGERLYIAGESGLIAYSDDKGSSWTRMEVEYEGSFFDVQGTTQGLIAAGLRGNVYRFDNDNGTWLHLDSGTTASINSIVQLSDERVLLVGNNGTLLTLNGDSITAMQTDDGQPVVDAIEFNGQAIAVGTSGVQTLDLNN